MCRFSVSKVHDYTIHFVAVKPLHFFSHMNHKCERKGVCGGQGGGGWGVGGVSVCLKYPDLKIRTNLTKSDTLNCVRDPEYL